MPKEEVLNPREEMLVLLFRNLTVAQQREAVLEMLALQEANEITQRQLGKTKLETISNERVRELFKAVPAVQVGEAKRKKKKRGPSRGPGDEMGDYPDER
jgi:parvulin-like peptidyl-prolyl isomerase